ncbi:DNA mismatch repair protein MutS [Klebsiella variicola]|nr:DNA mismatch repair protein MutS [Klebsiella variicola]
MRKIFAESSLIEGRRGLRRRPLWEFEIDTRASSLTCSSAPAIWSASAWKTPHAACGAAGCLLQYVKDTQRTSLPHIRSITMERQQDSIIMDAATRRTSRSPRIWPAAPTTPWPRYSTVR